jgi:hypothetical protein
MHVVPQQDWSYYEDRVRNIDAAWLRSLTFDKRFALYNDMFNLLWSARHDMPGDWARLDQHHWEEKISLRRRMVEACAKMDQMQRERAAANHTL